MTLVASAMQQLNKQKQSVFFCHEKQESHLSGFSTTRLDAFQLLHPLPSILFQYWTDIYLSWNPESYPGVQNLRFPSNLVWVPDILLYNRWVVLSAQLTVTLFFI